jgi:hypothetical protein
VEFVSSPMDRIARRGTDCFMDKRKTPETRRFRGIISENEQGVSRRLSVGQGMMNGTAVAEPAANLSLNR